MSWDACMRVVLLFAVSLAGCAATPSSDTAEWKERRNSAGVFAGATFKGSETGFSTGVMYLRRLSELWGVGAILEYTPALDERIVTVPGLFAFPFGGLSLVAAPGIEVEDGDVSFMTRFGAGWDFELGRGFTIAPEVNVDLVEGGGDIPVIVGLTFGYDF